MNDVLVIDDQTDARRSTAEFLRSHGHRVGVARSGREAISRQRTNAYGVVVLDFKMPKMDGVEVAQIIRREFPQTRIIGCTAYGQEYKPKAKLLVDEWISKPVLSKARSSALLAAVRKKSENPHVKAIENLEAAVIHNPKVADSLLAIGESIKTLEKYGILKSTFSEFLFTEIIDHRSFLAALEKSNISAISERFSKNFVDFVETNGVWDDDEA